MTTKARSEQPRETKAKRPRLQKEKIKDLDAKQAVGDQVKGGLPTTSKR